MKIFESLKQALEYQTTCPICHQLLMADSKTKVKQEYDNKFSFSYSSKSNEAILVDKITEEVSFTKIVSDSIKRKTLKVNGQFWTSLYVECESCQKYSYNIQLKFNIQDLKLFEISLSSESITFEENDLITEIRNGYFADETWLITYCGNETKTMKLPLISINLDNPTETLNRIRKLATFS